MDLGTLACNHMLMLWALFIFRRIACPLFCTETSMQLCKKRIVMGYTGKTRFVSPARHKPGWPVGLCRVVSGREGSVLPST